MFILGNALAAIASLIDWAAQIYVFILIGAVICSWVNADPFNPIVRILRRLSDPFLNLIRRVIPPIAGLDFSALIGILILQFGVRMYLVITLRDLARRLR